MLPRCCYVHGKYSNKRCEEQKAKFCCLKIDNVEPVYLSASSLLSSPPRPTLPDVYHLVFSPPTSTAVAGRLVEEEGGVTANVHAPLELYHRHSHSLLTAYFATHCKTFNADQPLGDLVSQGQHLLSYDDTCATECRHFLHTLIIL